MARTLWTKITFPSDQDTNFFSRTTEKAHTNVKILLIDLQPWANLHSSWNCQHVNSTRSCSSHQNRTRGSQCSSKLHTAQMKTPPLCFLCVSSQSPAPLHSFLSRASKTGCKKSLSEVGGGVALVTSCSKSLSVNSSYPPASSFSRFICSDIMLISEGRKGDKKQSQNVKTN